MTERELTIKEIQAYLLANPTATRDDILDFLRKLYGSEK